MEKNLDRIMEELINKPGVYGCVFADHQGLCLGVKGKASTDSAGVIAAIAEQAAKLEPKSKMPVIHLEKDNKSCTIHRSGTVTGAVFKNVL
ncbi:ragulator complex protein LAMTOR5 [Anoplophora glabripennis]|uniref:ragulator complex protein LAMTOR5 n=1 Tax=Anoplophora glabripennis TaxID=217634 RepID=UPI00087415EF|nr:ragulator complex protein LAMTOR5 [Anoplophora glabripennis]XP_018576486.1 ragulator complex protein LAMTOR5 [Anoplophora glabripennis]